MEADPSSDHMETSSTSSARYLAETRPGGLNQVIRFRGLHGPGTDYRLPDRLPDQLPDRRPDQLPDQLPDLSSVDQEETDSTSF